MSKHLERELDQLQKKLLSLAALAEDQVKKAVRAVETKDSAAAAAVVAADHNVDMLEIEVEEDCLKLLALHQPVAVDLRFTVAVLKINNDLERIADLAANIADKAIKLAPSSQLIYNDKLNIMCEKTIVMLRNALDSLFTMNATKAREVCDADDEIDELNREIITYVKNGVENEKNMIAAYLLMLSVSKNLERIADHATNIAEDVIYMIDGDIVRHMTE